MTLRKLYLSVAMTLSFSPVQVLASNWTNVGPIRSGDMTAFVDYQIKSSVPAGDIWHGGAPQGPSSYNSEADPIWANIQRANLYLDIAKAAPGFPADGSDLVFHGAQRLHRLALHCRGSLVQTVSMSLKFK